MQSKINGELAVRLHDGIAAALVSFGSGLVLLVVLIPALPAGRRGMAAIRTALRAGGLRPWQCLGGVAGAFLVVSQGLTVATIGVAMFTVALIAGQVTSSLAVDRAGIGPAGRQPLSAARTIGAVLTVVAVLVAMSPGLGNPTTLVLATLPALAGVGFAWQQAVNGRVRVAAGGALPAALVNFLVGTVALAVVFAVSVIVRGAPRSLPSQPWLYTGGALGIVFIAVSAAVVRTTGVLLLGLGQVAGQLLSALAIELIFPAHGGGHLPTSTLVGAGLTLVAVGVAALPRHQAART